MTLHVAASSGQNGGLKDVSWTFIGIYNNEDEER